jgi:hypothetical protein
MLQFLLSLSELMHHKLSLLEDFGPYENKRKKTN